MAKKGTIAIKFDDLLPYRDLLNRWIGATKEEIAHHSQRGELRAYSKYKGPIQGIVWCENKTLYMSEFNPQHIDVDTLPDFVLKEDVARLEQENPEYIGKFLQNDLSIANFIKTDLQPLHEGMRLFSAIEVMKLLQITPMEFLRYINGYYVYEDEQCVSIKREVRLVTTDEIDFQEWTLNEPFFDKNSFVFTNVYKKDLLRKC